MRQPDPRQLPLPFDSPEVPSQPASEAAARAVPKIVRLLPALDAPPAEPPPVSGKRRRLEMNSLAVDYLLLRSKRRSIGFVIDDQGLRVTAPRWLGVADIEDAIRSKEHWIVSKLEDRLGRISRPQPRTEWRDGTVLPYLGGDLVLRLELGKHGPAKHDEASGELTLTVPDYTTDRQVSERVREWMQSEAKRIFSRRAPIYEAGLGVACNGIGLTSAAGRWGSCSPTGRIRLNWRLIHFPLRLIDYVIAHELAHLREMNHGPRFWEAVASVCPDYEQAKKELNEKAQSVMNLF